MEDFSLDLTNILDPEEIEALQQQNEKPQETPAPETTGENQNNNEDTEEPSIQDLFGTEVPESVGDEKNKESEKKDTTTDTSDGSSPKSYYSSIAKAFKVDGIFSDIDDEDIDKVTSPEDFADLVNKQIVAKFDERQKRIDDALNNGMEPSEIQMYENSIANLDSIKDEDINDESEKGINLRKLLIKTDYINKGVDSTRAEMLAQRAVDNNTDIEDAKIALEGNREFYKNKYKEALASAEKEAKEIKAKRDKQMETLRVTILEGNKAFGEISVDKATRQKIYDTVSKPVFKTDNNTYLTELQKYQSENPVEFMKNIGYLYVITDGFKSLNNLENSIKKKATSKGIRELEHTLNSTVRNPDGSLKYVSGVGDNDSYINSGWSIDTQ